MKKAYNFVAGLWYPAALGAGIAWGVQACSTRAEGAIERPSMWALLFGLWFLIYHAAWFMKLTTDLGTKVDSYTCRHFLSDVIDGGALLLAFVSLGFATGQPHLLDHGLLFVAAALVPASALLGNAKVNPKTWGLTLFALIVPLSGAVTKWGVRTDVYDCLEVVLLALLYGLLALYLSVPQWFGSRA